MKWRPCIFKACGRVEHVGRARFDAKLGAWRVREMRPGSPPAPSLYGPGSVYAITWLTRAERDRQVAEASRRAEEAAIREHRQAVVDAIEAAIGAGNTTKRAIIGAAWGRTEADVSRAFVAEVFAEMADGLSIEKIGRRWARVDDIPF